MAKLNNQYKYIPNSFLEILKASLGQGFSDLPKRIQNGYLALFLNNRRITNANRHKIKHDSFMISKDELRALFGEYQRFRDVNFNGYSMKPRKTNRGTSQSIYSICKFSDSNSKLYKPLHLIEQTYEGHPGSTKADNGLLSGYRLTEEVQGIIDSLIESPINFNKDSMYMMDLKGNKIDIKNLNAKGIVRSKSSTLDDVNIRKMVDVSLLGMWLYRLLLSHLCSLMIEYGEETSIKEGCVDRVISKGGDQWSKVVGQIEVYDKTLESIYHKIIHEKKVQEICTRERLDELTLRISRRLESMKETVSARREGGRRAPLEGDRGAPSLVVEKTIESMSKPLNTLVQKDLSLLNIRDQIGELEDIMIFLREAGMWKIPVLYEECDTGRYFASVLQGYHKEVRYSALKDHYAYDIEAAHPNILIQTMDRSGIDFPELDVMREYVKDKKNIRINLASELGITVPMVKSILQVLTYGARLSKSKQEALYTCCNENIETVTKVKDHPWIQKYRKTFDVAFDKYVGNEKKIVNAVGIKIKLSKDTKAQKMAHILQGYEREILDTIIKWSEFGFIALLLHDCVVFKGKVDADNLSILTKRYTGFDLSFEEEKY